MTMNNTAAMHRTIVPDGEKTVDRGGRISGWQKK